MHCSVPHWWERHGRILEPQNHGGTPSWKQILIQLCLWCEHWSHTLMSPSSRAMHDQHTYYGHIEHKSNMKTITVRGFLLINKCCFYWLLNRHYRHYRHWLWLKRGLESILTKSNGAYSSRKFWDSAISLVVALVGEISFQQLHSTCSHSGIVSSNMASHLVRDNNLS